MTNPDSDHIREEGSREMIKHSKTRGQMIAIRMTHRLTGHSSIDILFSHQTPSLTEQATEKNGPHPIKPHPYPIIRISISMQPPFRLPVSIGHWDHKWIISSSLSARKSSARARISREIPSLLGEHKTRRSNQYSALQFKISLFPSCFTSNLLKSSKDADRCCSLFRTQQGFHHPCTFLSCNYCMLFCASLVFCWCI